MFASRAAERKALRSCKPAIFKAEASSPRDGMSATCKSNAWAATFTIKANNTSLAKGLIKCMEVARQSIFICKVKRRTSTRTMT